MFVDEVGGVLIVGFDKVVVKVYGFSEVYVFMNVIR